MPYIRMNVRIEQKGAVFNASEVRAEAARMVIAINDALATEGVLRVISRLRMVLQKPTGYYVSQVTVDRRAVQRGITDQGVVYGGWLEGVSSRNATTSFKGYHVFREVKAELDRDKEALAAPMVADFVNRMNT